ncbi:MAG: hypothetical protein O9301_10395 [Leptospira sp.]|nr:hypothetical protein [Leptospira sp.]
MIKNISQKIEAILIYLNQKQWMVLTIFFLLWTVCTLSYWKKYEWNPSSMVNFGKEFANRNKDLTPNNAILFLGEKGDLGAGYDGQIFYYFSVPLSNFSMEWPKGFDESYRAPRIGYPFLIGIFGLFGKSFAVFGMYFWNLTLILISYFCLRSMLSSDSKRYSIFYLLSPFALGSYYVLVSDSVMVSLLIIAYFLLQRRKYTFFVIVSSLAILTKEPALFFLFPLGLKSLTEKNVKKSVAVAFTLLIPILWHLYLSHKFPNWRATRLTDFILPFEGMITYSETIWRTWNETESLKELARLFSRFPLLILFFMGVILSFTGNLKRGWEFRIAILLTMFMIGTAGYYHFWSVYENVSRMFTLSIPMIIFLKDQDHLAKVGEFFSLVFIILLLFILKAVVISKPLLYQVGF